MYVLDQDYICTTLLIVSKKIPHLISNHKGLEREWDAAGSDVNKVKPILIG